VRDVRVTRANQNRLHSPLIRSAAAITVGIIVILFLEVILRLGAFLWFDYSQYYLYYGFHGLVGRVGISPWSTNTGQHYKFPSHYVLQGAAGQASETASINGLGFRGPEFQAIKPAGVFRIISMGESSTFGFHNSDTGTYPFQLENLFRQYPGGAKIEVINAGFPYYNSGSILSLFSEEIVNYNPDVLTLYNAFNDVGWPFDIGISSRAILWVHQHSIIYLLMKDYLITDRLVLGLNRKLQKLLPQNMDYTAFENEISLTSTRYRENMKAVIGLAKSKAIPVILIKQPMTTRHNRYASLSYEEEYNAVLVRFSEKKRLTSQELQLIRHHHLIKELEKIAEEENLPMVDNIAIVDQDRRRLASWVHLTEEGNLRLAEALKSAIEPYIAQKFAASGWHEVLPHPHK
jgi:lysophospholipase L1-like esterase